MRIGIDARFAVGPRRGIGNYSLNLIRELADLDSANQYILYTDRADTDKVLPDKDNIRIRMLRPAFYPAWEQLLLPLAARADRLDVLHSLGNTGPLWLPATIRRITSIHDVMFLKGSADLPAVTTAYQRLGRWYRRFVVPVVATASDHIMTMSHYSKRDILGEIEGLREDRIHVSYLAADPASGESAHGAMELPDKFIFCLGAVDPRKNTERVVRCFLALTGGGHFDGVLLVAGMNRDDSPAIKQILNRSECGESVRFLGFVSEQNKMLLYAHACAFVYVSHYEGFGLPLVEAMNGGAPIVSSGVSSIPEIVGDAALLVDPRSDSELLGALQRVVSDSVLARQLVERGKVQAERFTWKSTALSTEDVYRLVEPTLSVGAAE